MVYQIIDKASKTFIFSYRTQMRTTTYQSFFHQVGESSKIKLTINIYRDFVG